MPIFNESYDAEQHRKHYHAEHYVYSLEDCFRRDIPVISIEFNPPPVPDLARQRSDYWLKLTDPDEWDHKILRALKSKLKALHHCRRIGAFVSVTDSAAGVLRLHNLAMIRLLNDADFCDRMLNQPAYHWEPNRTIVHLTRNHDINWLRACLRQCQGWGFRNLLVITGDPLKEVRFKPVRANIALAMDEETAGQHRLKNSVELLQFITQTDANFHLGVGHNPFLNPKASGKHLLAKVEAGAKYIITQPVSYYEECWQVMDQFQDFCDEQGIRIPVVLGVFNYHVRCDDDGFDESQFAKRYKFWKRLFGFVPKGVRQDYEMGLDGIEILARSINKLKRKGNFHFDVMNAERRGWAIVRDGHRFTHEQDRLTGHVDPSAKKHPDTRDRSTT